jgi:hypothetical protein
MRGVLSGGPRVILFADFFAKARHRQACHRRQNRSPALNNLFRCSRGHAIASLAVLRLNKDGRFGGNPEAAPDRVLPIAALRGSSAEARCPAMLYCLQDSFPPIKRPDVSRVRLFVL